MRKVTASLLLIVLASATNAADLKTYRCHYSTFSDGEAVTEVEEKFELIFVVDADGDVTLVGNQGSSKVIGIGNKAGEGVNFIEVTPVGNIMTTVVDSKLESVHSRHTLIRGDVVASQYYGKCSIQ